MVKGEQNHRKTIDANGSRGKKPSYPIAPKKWPLFTSWNHYQMPKRSSLNWFAFKKVITFFYPMIHLDLPTHQTIPHFGNL